MLPFSALQELESIEVFTYSFKHRNLEDSEDRNPWDAALLVELDENHHNLKRVYIKDLLQINKLTGETCDYFLWEKQESWQRHRIAPFTDWDMVTGFEHRIVD